LEDVVNMLGDAPTIHLEGDVLLFVDASELAKRLSAIYTSLATTFDHPDRAVPGIFFAQGAAGIRTLNEFTLLQLAKGDLGPLNNDMTILADFRKQKGNSALSALPVIPPNYSGEFVNALGERADDPDFLSRDAQRLGLVFDAAALGQHIGGTDPRNNRFDDRGFINEKSVYRIDALEVSIGAGIHLRSSEGEKFYPVATLHLHNKAPGVFRSPRVKRQQEVSTSHIGHPRDIPEHEIITSERIQLLADISITDASTFNFQRPDLRNPSARVVIAFSDTGAPILDADSARLLRFSNIIFLNTHLVELFFEHLIDLITEPIVLITHASDHSINESHRELADDKRIKAWFAQNLNIVHPKIRAIPIGIANSQFIHGDTNLLSSVMRRNIQRRRLVECSFNLGTAAARRSKAQDLRKVGIHNRTKALSYEEYLISLCQSHFVPSPEGNGIDCHRTWEALYCGAYPIVDSRDWLYDFDCLPIVKIVHWSNITKGFLHSKLSSPPSRVNYSALTLSYWRNKLLDAS
jgi:hypothetical protein